MKFLLNYYALELGLRMAINYIGSNQYYGALYIITANSHLTLICHRHI